MDAGVRLWERAGRPFTTVVVGVDNHQGGRDAMALARLLVGTSGTLTPVRVLTVALPIDRGASPGAQISTHPPEAGDYPRLVEAPSVGRGLHDFAAVTGADVLVVGSCHRGAIGRVMLTDSTTDTLDGAPCAIAVAPFGYADRPEAITEIGVAYDGSPESQDALAMARALAATHRAKLSAFHVVPPPSLTTVPDASDASLRPSTLLYEARGTIASLGIEAHAAYGKPADELADYSASVDLLIVGSRGYGPLGRLVHGSTSRRLTHTARCPLLVLPRGAHPARPAVSDHHDGRPTGMAHRGLTASTPQPGARST